MQGISDSDKFKLQVCVTGMHLSPEFGLTFKEIEQDGFTINAKVDSLISSDSPSGIAKSVGLGAIGFGDCVETLKPDLLIVLGDRFEILPAVCAALFARIPVAHINGGETTEGAFDEAIRHSITKMSHIHFVAAEEYRNRVIQLGEHPDTVFNVGGLGVDNILNLNLLTKDKLEKALCFKLGKTNLLVTFHPATLDIESPVKQMTELLEALDELKDIKVVFTMPNADVGGKSLNKLINAYALDRPYCKVFSSLGQLRYFSCLQHFDLVIGNSSSGLAEVPSFKKPTINIGMRQRGRLKASSVIDCKPKKCDIIEAINFSQTVDFQEQLKSTKNPYGDGGAIDKILKILSSISFENIIVKKFYNIN